MKKAALLSVFLFLGAALANARPYAACSILQISPNEAMYHAVGQYYWDEFPGDDDGNSVYMFTLDESVDGVDHVNEPTKFSWVYRGNNIVEDTFNFPLSGNGGCDTSSVSAHANFFDSGPTPGAGLCYSKTICHLDVYADAGGSISGSDMTGNYKCTDCIELVAFPNQGWSFDYWSGDVNSNSLVANFCMNGSDRSVTAHFSLSPPGDPHDDPNGDKCHDDDDPGGRTHGIVKTP